MYYNLMFAATPPRIMRQRQWITFFTASSAQGWNWTTPEPFLYLQTIRPFSRPPIGLFQGPQSAFFKATNRPFSRPTKSIKKTYILPLDIF